MPIDTDLLVIGGGATGVGVARDAALRGVDVTLVERGALCGGTTGRSHGVLHSGARYADTDPTGARECIEENRVLRRVAGECVAETGGYMVELPADDPEYFEEKLDACRGCGLDPVVHDGPSAREREPGLAAAAERAIEVPDAVLYPSRLVAATAAGAREHGARIEPGAPVVDVHVDEGRVTGATVRSDGRDGRDGETERIDAAHVVNAAGAWAGEVAALAGATVEMRPTKGVMVAVGVGGDGGDDDDTAGDDGLDTVLNRCRPASDGDIAVPHDGEVVLGTTSEAVADPDAYPKSGDEADRMVEECGKLLADLDPDAERRTYWGVRPLYAPDEDARDARSISRGFALLDHAARDERPGLTSIVGGKLTTHRLMAEAVTDHACERLGIEADCATATTPLPGADDHAELDRLVAEFGTRSPADEPVVGD